MIQACPKSNRFLRLMVMCACFLTAIFPVRLFGQLFQPTVRYGTAGLEAAYVAVGDLNEDGNPDLVVADHVSNTISILFGKGDGTFRSPIGRPAGGAPVTVLAVDVNGDGHQDLIVANTSPCFGCSGDGVVTVLRGRGDGTFGKPLHYDSGGFGPGQTIGPAALAVADVNGDGKLDIIVANCATRKAAACGVSDGIVSVLLGNGNGTFQRAVNSHTGLFFMGSAILIADVNGDGKPDAIVTGSTGCDTSCSQGFIGVMLGNGNGTFLPAVTYGSGAFSALGLSAGDVNGDGKLDVVLGACLTGTCPGAGAVSVLLGNGDGTFQPGLVFNSGGGLGDGTAVADIDGDGRLDIVVANVLGATVGVLLGNGDGTFQAVQTFPSGGNPGNTYCVAVGDLNRDGRADVVASSISGGDAGVVGVLIHN